jgi:hypothetical protein
VLRTFLASSKTCRLRIFGSPGARSGRRQGVLVKTRDVAVQDGGRRQIAVQEAGRERLDSRRFVGSPDRRPEYDHVGPTDFSRVNLVISGSLRRSKRCQRQNKSTSHEYPPRDEEETRVSLGQGCRFLSLGLKLLRYGPRPLTARFPACWRRSPAF